MADDREPLGRIVRETWVACVLDYFADPKLSWVESFDETDDFQREADMRIGSAVAARAVGDAKLDLDVMRMRLSVLAAHLPAIRDALEGAVTGAEYEARAKRFRAALEALGGGEGQERSEEKDHD